MFMGIAIKTILHVWRDIYGISILRRCFGEGNKKEKVYQNADLRNFVGTHGSCVRCAIRRISV